MNEMIRTGQKGLSLRRGGARRYRANGETLRTSSPRGDRRIRVFPSTALKKLNKKLTFVRLRQLWFHCEMTSIKNDPGKIPYCGLGDTTQI